MIKSMNVKITNSKKFYNVKKMVDSAFKYLF